MIMTRGRRLIILYAAVLIIGCGGPLTPTAVKWTSIYPVPGAKKIGAAFDGVYIIKSETFPTKCITAETAQGYTDVILFFDGFNLTTVYRGEVFDNLWDINFLGNAGWAGGENFPNNEIPGKPILVFYNNGVWTRKEILNTGVHVFTHVIPVTENSCWVVGYNYLTGDETLFIYGSGNLKEIKKFRGIKSAVWNRKLETLYLWAADYAGGYKIFITENKGVSWYSETPHLPDFGYGVDPITGLKLCDTNGRDLLFTISFANSRFSGIGRRVKSNAETRYELLFLAGVSGAIHNVHNLATSTENKVLAVGTDASVHYDGVTWEIEELPYPLAFSEIEKSPAGGFWALAENLNVWGRRELLFHP